MGKLRRNSAPFLNIGICVICRLLAQHPEHKHEGKRGVYAEPFAPLVTVDGGKIQFKPLLYLYHGRGA